MDKKSILFSILVPLVEIIIGILLIASPTGLVKGIVVTFGLSLIIEGVMCVISYFRSKSKVKLFFGIIIVLSGLILALCCEIIADGFPAIAALYGIGLLIGAGVKIPGAIEKMKSRQSKRGGIFELLGILILIVIGIIALVNPFEAVTAAFTTVAVGLFFNALFSIIALVFLHKIVSTQMIKKRSSL